MGTLLLVALRAAPARMRRIETPAWTHWGGKAVFAVLDQGLFAGSNLLVTVLLARWLSAEAYGTFTLAYSIFLLLATVHTAVVTSPLLVFGVSEYPGGLRRYLGLLLLGHFVLTGTMSLLLVVAAGVFCALGMPALAGVLWALAAALPFVLTLWLARPACYVCFRPDWAAAGGVAYLCASTVFMYVLYRAHALSPAASLWTMGAASLCVAAGLLVWLRPQWPCGRNAPMRAQLRESLSLLGLGPLRAAGTRDCHENGDRLRGGEEYSRFARWSLSTMAMSWLGGNLQYFFLTATAGLASVAMMRILDTVLLPFHHVQAALSRLLTPALGARAADRRDLVPFFLRMLPVWVLLGLLAYATVRALGAPLAMVVYGGGYAQSMYLLAWYGLILIPEIFGEAAFALFKVVLRMDLVFAYQVSVALASVIGYLIVGRQGLSGVVSVRICVSYLVLPFVIMSVRAVCASARSS